MNKEIILKELKKADIEEVRIWRNNISINKNFLQQSLISSSQQITWFNNIDPVKEKYYIAYYKKKKIGLFYATNIDLEKKLCEPNGFIGIEEYIHTPIAGMALLTFFNFLFADFGMNELQGKILKLNSSFIQLHEQLNATISETQNPDIVKVELSKENFKEFINKYKVI